MWTFSEEREMGGKRREAIHNDDAVQCYLVAGPNTNKLSFLTPTGNHGDWTGREA